MIHLLWYLTLVASGANGRSTVVDVCDILRDPARFDGQEVRVVGLFRTTLEDVRLYSNRCPGVLLVQAGDSLTRSAKGRFQKCMNLAMRFTMNPENGPPRCISVEIQGRVINTYDSAPRAPSGAKRVTGTTFKVGRLISTCSMAKGCNVASDVPSTRR